MRPLFAAFCLMTMSLTALMAGPAQAENYTEFSDGQGVLEKLVSRVNPANDTTCFLDINFKEDLTLKAKEKYVFIEKDRALVLKTLAPRKSDLSEEAVSCFFSFKNRKSDGSITPINEAQTFRSGAVLILNEIVDINGDSVFEKAMRSYFGKKLPYELVLRGLDFGVALKCERRDGEPITFGDLKEALSPIAEVLMLCPVP